ncbi:MAG TPA: PKD domain-containing protein [Thermoplasmatales archaeon]|nr:PKD domain-containing protein [Thermoplasmatales archaeon]
MKTKRIGGILLVLVSVVMAEFIIAEMKDGLHAGQAEAQTLGRNILYVGGSGPNNYTNIQDAIDNASNGDTIKVYNGTYYENVVINKTINLIGEDRNGTIIDAEGNGIAVKVNANKVNISNFTLKNASLYYPNAVIKVQSSFNSISYCDIIRGRSCIYFEHSNNNTILTCNISDSDTGIYFEHSNNNTILTCNISDNRNGVDGEGNTNNNTISQCSIKNNENMGISLPSFSKVLHCNISRNPKYGIYISTSYNVISNCIISHNGYGLFLENSQYNKIRNNSLIEDSLFINDNLYHFTHQIVENNSVNGKPLLYLLNQTNIVLDNVTMGEIILGNCSNLSIRNVKISTTEFGIECVSCDNITIYNCDIFASVWFSDCRDNVVSSNNLYHVRISSYTTVSNNIIKDEIEIPGSYVIEGAMEIAGSHNIVWNNSIEGGIMLTGATYNNISYNVIKNASEGVTLLVYSKYNNISSNILSNVSYGIYAIPLWAGAHNDYNKIIHNLIECNICGIYMQDNNDNNVIRGNSIYNASTGIYLKINCDNAEISNNTIINFGWAGIQLYGSANSYIIGNTLKNGKKYGIFNAVSSVTVFHNNLINITTPARDFDNNTWDNGYPSGGNYYSNFDESSEGAWDNNSDGIVDSSYNISDGPSIDHYPLMHPYGPPYAIFEYVIENKTVRFNASLSGDYNGYIVSYKWNFGDGTNGIGKIVNHTYAEGGYYTVTLTVTDDDGATNSTTKQIIVSNVPPFADFTFAPLNPVTTLPVYFTDLSNGLDGSIVLWYWEFGDGSTSDKQNPSHQYYYEGTYVVNLTVWDDDGANDTISKNITVIKPSTDYILITFSTKNEIFDYNISTNFSFIAYASAFNYTYGFIEFVNANWSTANFASNASINATQGKNILFSSGWNDGTAILQAEYNGYTDSVVFTISSSLFSFILYKGWNLITLPCKNSYNASSLFNDIEGCSIILSWNASLQDFMLYAPGTPYDFVIEDGHGYFVGMNHDSIFSLVDSPIQSVNVTLYIGWNMLGWFKENETNASSLYNAIENCSIILSWNASLQNFELYAPGTPDFVIKQGDGFLVAVDKQSIWHGEG